MTHPTYRQHVYGGVARVRGMGSAIRHTVDHPGTARARSLVQTALGCAECPYGPKNPNENKHVAKSVLTTNGVKEE